MQRRKERCGYKRKRKKKVLASRIVRDWPDNSLWKNRNMAFAETRERGVYWHSQNDTFYAVTLFLHRGLRDFSASQRIKIWYTHTYIRIHRTKLKLFFPFKPPSRFAFCRLSGKVERKKNCPREKISKSYGSTDILPHCVPYYYRKSDVFWIRDITFFFSSFLLQKNRTLSIYFKVLASPKHAFKGWLKG